MGWKVEDKRQKRGESIRYSIYTVNFHSLFEKWGIRHLGTEWKS